MILLNQNKINIHKFDSEKIINTFEIYLSSSTQK